MKVSLGLPTLHGSETIHLPNEEEFTITLGQFIVRANDKELVVIPLEYHLQTDDLQAELKALREGRANGPYGGTPVVVLPNDKLTVVDRQRRTTKVDL